MQNLLALFKENSTYLGNGIIKLDGIINHRIYPNIMRDLAELIYKEFSNFKITKIVTAEASGIAPAFCVAEKFNVPLIYARKNIPATMSEDHVSYLVKSRTKQVETLLCISKEYISSEDFILIVDDILGSGGALNALINLVERCDAKIIGASCILEKTFEHARDKFLDSNLKIFSVIKADLNQNNLRFSF